VRGRLREPTPTTSGTATLTLDAIAYDAGKLGSASVPLSDAGSTLRAAWDTSSWQLADLVALADGVVSDPPLDEAALVAALEATVTDRGLFDAADLRQFAKLDTRAFVLGLEWLSTWLGSLDAVEGFGAQLPVVGMTVGDVLALADQVGREVADLVETIEAARPDPAAPADPSAQDLVRLLCGSSLMDCDEDASSPWGYELDGLSITPEAITYDVEFSVCQVLFGAEGPCGAGESWQAPLIDVTEAGPSLDLALPDLLGSGDDAGPLGGMAVSLRAGTWRGTAAASLAFRVSLDLRADHEVMTSLGITTDDFPTTGNPREGRLETGDLCRGLPLAILPGYSPTAFAAVNGALEDAAFTDDCDLLAWTEDGGGFASVKLPPPPADLDAPEGTEPPAPTDHTVTAEEVCRAAAYKHSVELGDFLAWNAFAGADLAAQLSTCAARAYAQITHDTGDLPPTFAYEPDRSGEPLPVGFRIGLEQLDEETPLASASVVVTGGAEPGTGTNPGERFGGEARLGFLDLEFEGDLSATPGVELALADPTRRLTLQDLADSADASTADGELAEGEDEDATTLLELVDAELTGGLEVDLDLYNSIAFPRPSSGAQVRVKGDLAELTADDLDLDAVTIASTCDDFDGVTTGVCYDLGDWTKLRQLSPAQVLRMVTGLLDRLAGVTGAGDASFELPVVGVSVQDLVAFNRKLNTIADTVEARDPEDLSSLQASIDAGLEAAGLPAGAVAVDVTEGGVFTLALPLSFSETASYPFSFDVGLGEGGPLPIRIAPADGGARISATGTASFTPTLGFDLDAPLETPLDERIFLVTSPGTDPTIGGSFEAEVAGAVTLGPIGVDLSRGRRGRPEPDRPVVAARQRRAAHPRRPHGCARGRRAQRAAPVGWWVRRERRGRGPRRTVRTRLVRRPHRPARWRLRHLLPRPEHVGHQQRPARPRHPRAWRVADQPVRRPGARPQRRPVLGEPAAGRRRARQALGRRCRPAALRAHRRRRLGAGRAGRQRVRPARQHPARAGRVRPAPGRERRRHLLRPAAGLRRLGPAAGRRGAADQRRPRRARPRPRPRVRAQTSATRC
jgi:hypothetical protein